ncbi:unnamed protein product [Pedinophyceae sp. YPF-701]|nr:unnamed protein product [Pedinophyceae sp. YPF-701]
MEGLGRTMPAGRAARSSARASKPCSQPLRMGSFARRQLNVRLRADTLAGRPEVGLTDRGCACAAGRGERAAESRASRMLEEMQSILEAAEQGGSASFASGPGESAQTLTERLRALDLSDTPVATKAALMSSLMVSVLQAAEAQADTLTSSGAPHTSSALSAGAGGPVSFHGAAAGLDTFAGAAVGSLEGSLNGVDGVQEVAQLAVRELGAAGDQFSQGLSGALSETLRSVSNLQTPVGASLDGSGAADQAHMLESFAAFFAALLHGIVETVHSVAPHLADSPAVASALAAAQDAVARPGAGTTLLAAAAAAGVLAILGQAMRGAPDDEAGAPGVDVGVPVDPEGLPLRYDPVAIHLYLKKRPMMVMRRTVVVGSEALRMGTALLMDVYTGKWRSNMPRRAVEARRILQDLGPTYVKLAQLMSTRVDMIAKPYLEEFTKLQDRVRPFSTGEAREILTEELGRPPEEVFQCLSERPVAAASIGQVYRGILREEFGGGEVAVKVQRPDIIENSSLDLYVIRRLFLVLDRLPAVSADLVALLDEWSERFFFEMDYTHEAENSMRFQADMKGLEGVTVADVYPELSTRRALVTSWVYGEKLSESDAGDVKALATTMLNCYLIQLLETGFLHADPHPGNLIRTPDGKICVLDFGLMAEVPAEQRAGLVNFIAHLISRDWDAVTRDLSTLGFIPEGAPDPKEAGLTDMLSYVFGQLVDGGGAGKSLSISQLMTEMEGVADNYPIQIPPYFALVFRAFGVLEGVALRVDPQYSIVQECSPYISRRLLTDPSEESRMLLRQLIYSESGRMDLRKLETMAQGMKRFSTAPVAARTDAPDAAPRLAEPKPALDPAVKDALRMIFSEEGAHVQELLVDELVASVDALSREAMGELVRIVVGSAGVTTALNEMEAFGPMTPIMVRPMGISLEMMAAAAPSVELTQEDEEALSNVYTVWELLRPELKSVSPTRAREALLAAVELLQLAPDVMPGVRRTASQFARLFLSRMAARVADELNSPRQGARRALPAPRTQPYDQYGQYGQARGY